MQIGNQLEAKSGYMGLQAGFRYVFLANPKESDSVLLVVFSLLKHPRTATLITMKRTDFEKGLLIRGITACKDQHFLPQNLWRLEGGFNCAKIDKKRRKSRKTSHLELINKRLTTLAPALDRESEILQSKEPEKLLNKIAREQHANETRFRRDFLLYVAHGHNQYALLPAVINNGRFKKKGKAEGRRSGRGLERLGRKYGTKLAKKTVDLSESAYETNQKRGRHLTTIYELSMVNQFKAKVVTDENGKRRFLHRNGVAIPTFDQFKRCVKAAFGLNTIQLNKYGKERHRRQYATQKGKYSSAVSNLMEQTEEDAYYTEDRPIGILDKSILPPLAVHRVVDVVSGMRCGIGFSRLKESSEGYDMAQFSVGYGTVDFCGLFGIKINQWEWPCKGLNMKQKRDRGPGIKREPGSQDPTVDSKVGPVIRKMTPTGQGQSKPNVESSHRRTVHHEGADLVFVSTLTQYEMAQREIFDCLKQNHTSDASAHMTEEMIAAGVRPTPIGIWEYLDERGRNVGQEISPDDAVRRFLKKINVTIKPDGVYIGHLRYLTEELKGSGLLSRNGKAKNRKPTCRAYVLPICVRFIWVEVNGFLLKVDAQLPSRDDKNQLNQTYDELIDGHKKLNYLKREQRREKNAIKIDYINRFQETTGKPYHSTKQVPRSKVGKQRDANRDVSDIRAFSRGDARE